MIKYGITDIPTTAGKRYIITANGRVSVSNRTYYKSKSRALAKAKILNKAK